MRLSWEKKKQQNQFSTQLMQFHQKWIILSEYIDLD